MIPNIDRVPATGKANRKLITPESGTAFYAVVERADSPIAAGAALNKAKLDEFLAASGTTAGTGSVLTLAQTGFALADGAPIRFKLHVVSGASATINVEGTGAIPIKTSKGKPMKAGMPAGTWISAVYSSTLASFILQGEGGGDLRYGNDPGQISTFELFMNGFNPNYSK